MSQSAIPNKTEPGGLPARDANVPPQPTSGAATGPATAPKRSRFFAKIETREEALKVIRDAAMFFFVVAGLQIVIAIVFVAMGTSDPAQQLVASGIDVAVFAGGGLALLKLNSRAAAIGLLCYSILSVAILAASGHVSYLSIIAVFVAIRAIIATFKLHGTLA